MCEGYKGRSAFDITRGAYSIEIQGGRDGVYMRMPTPVLIILWPEAQR